MINKPRDAIATMIYDYCHDKWVIIALHMGGNINVPAEYYSRRLTDEGRYRFPSIVDVECTKFEFGDGSYTAFVNTDGLEKPITLTESIKKGKTTMLGALDYLRNRR